LSNQPLNKVLTVAAALESGSQKDSYELLTDLEMMVQDPAELGETYGTIVDAVDNIDNSRGVDFKLVRPNYITFKISKLIPDLIDRQTNFFKRVNPLHFVKLFAKDSQNKKERLYQAVVQYILYKAAADSAVPQRLYENDTTKPTITNRDTLIESEVVVAFARAIENLSSPDRFVQLAQNVPDLKTKVATGLMMMHEMIVEYINWRDVVGSAYTFSNPSSEYIKTIVNDGKIAFLAHLANDNLFYKMLDTRARNVNFQNGVQTILSMWDRINKVFETEVGELASFEEKELIPLNDDFAKRTLGDVLSVVESSRPMAIVARERAVRANAKKGMDDEQSTTQSIRGVEDNSRFLAVTNV